MVDERICEAIRQLKVLEFLYDEAHRVVHPYCHGVTTTGNETLRAVQVGGRTRPGGLGFGKLWTVARMSEVRVTDRAFVPDDPNYNPDDSAMATIHCRVPRQPRPGSPARKMSGGEGFERRGAEETKP
jgi:hypothetical protein